MKLPTAQPIQNLDELIEVFGNQKTFKDRLAEWKKLETSINQKLADYEEVKNIESSRSKAQADLAHARKEMAKAKSMVEMAQQNADEIMTKTKAEAATILANIEDEKVQLRNLEISLSTKSKDLTKKEKEVETKEKYASELMATASAKMEAAEARDRKLQEMEKRLQETFSGVN